MGKSSAKAGPRFDRGKAAPQMRDVARKIITQHGLAGLSFRAVAQDLGLSHSAPLHHFGTIAGLLGAVASQAFDELSRDLQAARGPEPPSMKTLVELARTFAGFSLKNPNLYQAIHSADLWAAAAGEYNPIQGKNSPRKAAHERAERWVTEAIESRDLAFTAFIEASDGLLRTGQIKGDLDPAQIARLVTVLVDGYVFQYLNEKVDDVPEDVAVEYVGQLVSLALRGVVRSA